MKSSLQKIKSNNNTINNNEEDKLGRSTKIVIGRVLAGESEDRNSPEQTESYFSASQTLRESLSSPQLMQDGTLKQRVFSLEQAIDIQVRRDDVTYQNILALSKDSARIEQTLTQNLNDKTNTLEEALRVFKQEVHHRFELQNAENKRLQQHITTLKAENHQLQSELTKVTERVKQLESEFGDDILKG
mmetsp:Transcript_18399/g.19156  ORF Transcript_18399/g.19156 Transcript_18399/m.19156 type:complete len:188 (+) Transcript_18399:62-625(+)